jgi:high-affinity iron transporter
VFTDPSFFPTFFLTLREGLEAALIVGIIAAYLVKIDRPDVLGRVWLGVGAAIALSIGLGVAIVATIRELPLVLQETFEGLAALVAVGVLTWMLFWMRRQGRALKGELERGIDVALSRGSSLALITLGFVAVLREGIETSLFMIAILSAADLGPSTAIAGVGGIAVAVAIGVAIFAFGVRVNLGRFFTVTGTVLIFVAAGLVAFAIGEFAEAGLFANSGQAFDLSAVLPESEGLGAILNGLFGYRSSPTPLELAGYLLYLVPTLFLFVFEGLPLRRQPAAA